MKTRTLIFVAGAAGFVVCALVLTLLAFGVTGVLILRNIDLMYVLWPSSLILTVDWRSTALGMAITVTSVLLNCVTYIDVALAGRTLIRSSVRAFSR